MIKVWIIEDEEGAYEFLRSVLMRSNIEVVIDQWFQSVEQTSAALQQSQAPDLIFMDIQLSDGLSFEVFEQVSCTSPIVFVTAYDEYALKAFELNSIDYLLKPISKDAVQRALEKYQRHQVPKNLQQFIKSYYQHKAGQHQYEQRLIAKQGGDLVNINVLSIAYFYSDESCFCVDFDGRRYALNGSLSSLESKLPPQQFMKLNRKVIANKRAIHALKRILGSKLIVSMQPETDFTVVVSRDRATEVKNWFSE